MQQLHPHDAVFRKLPDVRTLSDLLPSLQTYLPGDLLDGGAFSQIQSRVGELPAVAATAFVFEFRLGTVAPEADVLVPVLPGTCLASHYTNLSIAASTTAACASFGRYLKQLADSECRLHRWISGTTLEYDLVNTDLLEHADPGVFFRLRLKPQPLPLKITPYNCSPGLMVETLADTVGWVATPAEITAMEQIVQAIGHDGEILHIGALPDRDRRAFRIVVRRLQRDRLGDTLCRLGWPGSIDQATEILDSMIGPAKRFQLAFDVTENGLLPRLGLEFYVDQPEKPDSPSGWLVTDARDWYPTLDRLRSVGWCLSSKARGLAEWPALTTINISGVPCRFYRGVNHVKITIDADQSTDAKAYAAISVFPL